MSNTIIFFTAFVGEYFKTTKEEESKDKKSFLEGYKSILNSKSNDESLVGKLKLLLHISFHM